MIAAALIMAYFLKAYEEKWGYILGASGQICTQAIIDYSARKWPGNTATRTYGAQWLGRRVIDCSGLFYVAFKLQGQYMPHGSNSIWNKGYLTRKGVITPGVKLRPGTAVFLRQRDPSKPDGWDYHHIGLYVGGAIGVIEAKGTRWGVVRSSLDSWDCWGELKYVQYEGEEAVIEMPVICRAVVTTKGGHLNLRDAPDGRDVGDVPNGTVLDVLEKTTAEWWKVVYNGVIGWVSAAYLQEQPAADAVAVVLPRATWAAVRDAISAVIQ